MKRGRGFLRVIDGFKTDQNNDNNNNNEFLSLEEQIRVDYRILNKRKIEINPENKLQYIELLLLHHPSNAAVKLMAAETYFEKEELVPAALGILRDIEELIILEEAKHDKINFVYDIKQIGNETHLKLLHFQVDYTAFLKQKSENSIEDCLLKSYAYVLCKQKLLALELFREIDSNFFQPKYIYNLYARRLEACGLKDEAKAKRKEFSAWLLSNDGITKNKIKNAMRSVVEFQHMDYKYVQQTAVAIRYKSKEDAENEKKLIEKAQEIVFEKNQFKAVESRSISVFEKNYYHVLSREKGENLLKIVEDESQKEMAMHCLEITIDYLALLHSKMQQMKKIDKFSAMILADNLISRLTQNEVELSKDEIRGISYLSTMFKESYNCFSKDGHPENWIVQKIGDKIRVVAIDFEPKMQMPQVFDIANLLKYGNYVNKTEEKILVDRYYDQFCLNANNNNNYYGNNDDNYNKFIDKERFYFTYLNGIVYRMLSFYCAWQNPRKAGYVTRLPVLIKNGINTISEIKQPALFNEFVKGEERHSYVILEELLLKLEKI